jgi:hypothetical protein
MRAIFKFVAAIAALSAVPAQAERIQLRDKDFSGVQPGKAYVLIETGSAGAIQIFRRPSAEQAAAWQAKRDKSYARAKSNYDYELELYEDYRNKKSGTPVVKPKPLDDAFFVAPPELKNFVNVLNQPFVKGGNVTLLALEPGEYVFYTVPGSGAVAQGQCLCMGSVGFTAEAGKIVSVGRMVGMEGREFRFVAADDKFEAPAMLKPYNVSPAKLVAVGKLPNFFGAIVTRVAPVPGLLAYKRDIPLGGGDQEAVGLN